MHPLKTIFRFAGFPVQLIIFILRSVAKIAPMNHTKNNASQNPWSDESAHWTQRTLHHLSALTQIGPRPATQNGERRAALYARERLQNAGIERVREELLLSGRHTYRPYSLALGAALLANLSGAGEKPARVRSLLATVGSAAAIIGFAREANLQPNWTRRVLPQGDSQNIVAIVPARGRATRRVVIHGHLDSHRTPIFYSHPLWLRAFSTIIGCTFASLCIDALRHAASTCSGKKASAKLSLVTQTLQTIACLLTLQAETTPHTIGANDNASGAATVLSLGERLALQPLENTEVWIVGNGCEEVGCYGIAALLRRHPIELREAYFLNFDMLGIGTPSVIAREGLLLKQDADAHLLALAHQVGEEFPDLWSGAHDSDAYTDSGLTTRQGFAALTIDAQLPKEHPSAAQMGHWHQPSDRLENIEFACLARAQEFGWQLLQRIDRESQRATS